MKHIWQRRQLYSYCYGSIVQGRLLTHHSGGDHGGGEVLRQGFSSPAGCWEELLDPPDLATMTAATCSMFHGKVICPLGFFLSRGIYSRKGSVRGWASWPHPLVTRARGRPRHPRVWLAPGPLYLIFGLRDVSGIIEVWL
jgi:hypothetical protein